MNPEKTVIELNQSQQLFTEGNFKGAIAVYRRVIENDPHNKTAYYGLGESFAKLGQLEDAIAAYRQAIQLIQQEKQKASDREEAIKRYRQAIEDNPDRTSEYYKLLELEPDNQEVLLQLAQAVVRQGKLDDAITAYRRASELSPDTDWIHYALANALQQRTQSDLADAIASYRHIIELNPDKVEAYHNLLQVQPDNSETWLQLAQAFVRQEQREDAIRAYRRAIELNPISIEANHELAVALARQEQWDEAMVACQRAVELAPKLAEAYYLLGEVQVKLDRKEEAISSYRHAGELLVKQGKIDEAISAYEQVVQQQPSAADYFNFGMLLLQQHRVEEGLSCYQKALEIQPEQAEDYSTLAILLIREGLLKEVIGCYDQAFNRNPSHAGAYHRLSMILAEQGLIDEAIVCFQETPQRQPTVGEVCEYIWKGLHQLGLLDETSLYCQTEIQWDAAHRHFMHNSDYTTINLYSLTEADHKKIESVGCLLPNLKLMEQDNLRLEEIYINSFRESDRSQLTPLGFANFQQSILTTGYIYSVCPISGRIIKSNQSLYLRSTTHFGYQIAIYRFVGSEIFYLILASCHPQIKLGIYFPKTELIIKFRNYPVNLNVCLDDLKSKIVACWQEFKYYISTENPKELVALSGFIYNAGHYFWNDMSGLQDLCDSGKYNQLNKVAVADNSFIDINDYFPELTAQNINKTIISTEDNHQNSLFKMIVKNNWMAFNITSPCIQERLANRLHDYARVKCNQSFLCKVEESKKHFPLLWVTLRSHSRVWLSEVEGISNIINELYKDYPNLGIIFDGHPREKSNVARILSNIDSNISTYNAVECLIHETLVWVHAIDLFIAPIGAGSVFTSIANKTGVFHSNTGWFGEGPICLNPRENCVLAINILKKYIMDADGSICYGRNYDCDWKVIYDEVINIVNKLKQERLIGDPN